MKRFIDELQKASDRLYADNSHSANAEYEFKRYKKTFSDFIGRRALYTDKSTKESRVVTIIGVYDRYLIAKYNYYGMDYRGALKTSVLYSSLLCGESKLAVE